LNVNDLIRWNVLLLIVSDVNTIGTG